MGVAAGSRGIRRGRLRPAQLAAAATLGVVVLAGCSHAGSAGGGPEVGGAGGAAGVTPVPTTAAVAGSGGAATGTPTMTSGGGSGFSVSLPAIAGSPTAGNSSGSTAAPAASSTSVRSNAWFATPSKNIACFLDAGGARCDIAQRSWTPPPKPSACELDWANGINLSARGASLTCAGDTVLGPTELLGYGRAIRVGDIVCTSLQSGMRCDDTATRHGFMLAREAFTIF